MPDICRLDISQAPDLRIADSQSIKEWRSAAAAVCSAPRASTIGLDSGLLVVGGLSGSVLPCVPTPRACFLAFLGSVGGDLSSQALGFILNV